MGQNLVLNMDDHGFVVSKIARDPAGFLISVAKPLSVHSYV